MVPTNCALSLRKDLAKLPYLSPGCGRNSVWDGLHCIFQTDLEFDIGFSSKATSSQEHIESRGSL